jgi:hypothetical protein
LSLRRCWLLPERKLKKLRGGGRRAETRHERNQHRDANKRGCAA